MSNNMKRLRATEQDVHLLLAHFTSAVKYGAAPSFATFKSVWTQRHFSWIYMGNSTYLSADKYVQYLYSVALDCLDIPLSYQPAGPPPVNPQSSSQSQPQPDVTLDGNHAPHLAEDNGQPPNGAQAAAENGNGALRHAPSLQEVSDVLLGEEEDEEPDDENQNVIDDAEREFGTSDDPDLSELVADDIVLNPGFLGSLGADHPDTHYLSQQRCSREGSPVVRPGAARADLFPDIELAGNELPSNQLPFSQLPNNQVPNDHLPGNQLSGGNEELDVLATLPDVQLVSPPSSAGREQPGKDARPIPEAQHSVPLLQAEPAPSHSQFVPPATYSDQSVPGPVPAASAAPFMSSGASLAAKAAMRAQRLVAPRRDMYSQNVSHHSKPNPAIVPFATKVGGIYAVYCMYETQPGHAPIYLPLEVLQQLLNLAKEAHSKMVHDVVRVLRQLMQKNAFVVGAVRRPPRDSAAADAAAQPPSRLAASSLSGIHSKIQKERDCVYHVQCMYRGLGIVGKLVGMCKEYKQAKQDAFHTAQLPQAPKGIANLTVGARLAQLLNKATTQMQPKIARKKLRGPRGKRTKKPVPGEDATPPGANTTQAAEDSTAAPMEVDEADVVDEGADELMNILDASLADLGSDDETGGPAPATGTNRVDEEDGDVDVIGTAFPKASKGVKAAMQKTDARRRRRNMATKAWKAFEERVTKKQRCTHETHQQPSVSGLQHLFQAPEAAEDWADTYDADGDDAYDNLNAGSEPMPSRDQPGLEASTANGPAFPRPPASGTAAPTPPPPFSSGTSTAVPAAVASAVPNGAARPLRQNRTAQRVQRPTAAPSATAVERPESENGAASTPEATGAALTHKGHKLYPIIKHKARDSHHSAATTPPETVPSAAQAEPALDPAQQQAANGSSQAGISDRGTRGQSPSLDAAQALMDMQQLAWGGAPHPASSGAASVTISGTGPSAKPPVGPRPSSRKRPAPQGPCLTAPAPAARRRAAPNNPSLDAPDPEHVPQQRPIHRSNTLKSPQRLSSSQQQKKSTSASAPGKAAVNPDSSGQQTASHAPGVNSQQTQPRSMAQLSSMPTGRGLTNKGKQMLAAAHARVCEQSTHATDAARAIHSLRDSVSEIDWMLENDSASD